MEFKLPTETVELPSKGLLYPEGHPLASGTVEMKYMTAKEEDILSNQNYIKNGTVIEKLLRALLITEVDFNEILIGDVDAIMIAARVLSYGKDYEFSYLGQRVEVDLTSLSSKEFGTDIKRGVNEFSMKLPTSGNEITFKLLTQGDDKAISKEIEGLKKISKDSSAEVSTRLKYMITSINGSRDRADVRKFVDGFMLAADARALREEYARVSPGVDLTTVVEGLDGEEEVVAIPIGVTFFWPDA